ncbi:MAG: hypothetical protein IPO21_08390 [Bacteroidales bacterium]|nr:hypothetical protein [Bacteroidales bacterium]
MTQQLNIKLLATDHPEIQISNNVLIFDSRFLDPMRFSIHTIYGQEVMSGIVAHGSNSIALHNLGTGIYEFKLLDFSYRLVVD